MVLPVGLASAMISLVSLTAVKPLMAAKVGHLRYL